MVSQQDLWAEAWDMDPVWSPNHPSVGLPCPTLGSSRFWILYLLAELLLSYVGGRWEACLSTPQGFMQAPAWVTG